MAEYTQPQVLPVSEKITPNQHSWSETKDVMGMDKKGKWKYMHAEAYSGCERSRKKAKHDVRVLLVMPTSYSYIHQFSHVLIDPVVC